MPIRSDLQIKDGAIHVRDENKSDMREKLPEVKLTDRLASTLWGQIVRKDAGSHADDPALLDFESAHTVLANGAQKLVAQRESQNPGQTQAAHLADVHAQYERYLGSGARSMDKARANIKAVSVRLIRSSGSAPSLAITAQAQRFGRWFVRWMISRKPSLSLTPLPMKMAKS